MKYTILAALSATLLIGACAKENLQNNHSSQTHALEFRSDGNNLVTLCHQLGNGQYEVIQVNENAVPAHLDHGDKLVDADGDGYTAPDCCTGSMNDCDDNNADVNPGAQESCGNGLDDDCDGYTDNEDSDCGGSNLCFNAEFLEANGPYWFYYDSDVLTCDLFFGGVSEVLLLANEGLFLVALTSLDGEAQIVGYQNFVTEELCLLQVGVNITEQDYENAVALINAYLAAHPEVPNYCDEFPLLPSEGDNGRISVKKIMNTLPAEMLKKLDNK